MADGDCRVKLNKAAIEPIGWSGGYAFSETLIELLNQQEQPALAHLAARCLGEMFDPDRPSRLSRFVSNTHYRHWQGPTPQEGRLRERVIDRNVPGLSNPF